MITNGAKSDIQIVAFSCNWSAYSAIEMAGLNRMQYSAGLKLVRLPCLGRVNTGMVLQALELGAVGVLLLGCPAESCHYGIGARQADAVLTDSRRILSLLGLPVNRVMYIQLPAGDCETFISKLNDFIRTLKGGIDQAGDSCCPKSNRI